jgi:catechol 2,3-dioxygenase-like lactoylglutathione lyase family enzyme
MKRFHVNVAVADLERSAQFYANLFGVEPTVLKDDYAKWMLDDPRINFSISTSSVNRGVNHLGLQADTMGEFESIQARLKNAEQETFEQVDAQCCYANSSKTWVRDPDDVAWETFVTHAEITTYGDDRVPENVLQAKKNADCCEAGAAATCCVQ